MEYHTLLYSRNEKKNPNWYFIKHEILSEKTIEEFKKIFNYLKIRWYKKSEKYIIHTTSSENPSERDDGITHLISRNSKENIYNWKYRLLKDEVKIIKKKMAGISEKFYEENEW